MKALVFSEQIDFDSQEVTSVILVPNATPKIHDLQDLHNQFVQKKINKELLPELGDKAKLKNGNFSNLYFRSVDKFIKDKKYDFESWVIKTYKGKIIKFESNF
jgi:hypothetical protein